MKNTFYELIFLLFCFGFSLIAILHYCLCVTALKSLNFVCYENVQATNHICPNLFLVFLLSKVLNRINVQSQNPLMLFFMTNIVRFHYIRTLYTSNRYTFTIFDAHKSCDVFVAHVSTFHLSYLYILAGPISRPTFYVKRQITDLVWFWKYIYYDKSRL